MASLRSASFRRLLQLKSADQFMSRLPGALERAMTTNGLESRRQTITVRCNFSASGLGGKATGVGDLKVFRVDQQGAQEIPVSTAAIERTLHQLFEQHLETLLGVRFLASEYSTGKLHGGRIDTLGIDENGSPVIVEYKRTINENVINQGLFYLEWLQDHRGDFKLLVLEQLGGEVANGINWETPRVLCVAADFTRYDENAVKQISRSIELIRYRYFGDNLLSLELLNSGRQQIPANVDIRPGKTKPAPKTGYKTIVHRLEESPALVQQRFGHIRDSIMALGDEVEMRTLQDYFAFRRLKNFACVEVYPQARRILIFVKVDPDTVPLTPGFARDVRNIGHFGTGDLEITIDSDADIDLALPLIRRSYESN